MKRGLWHDGCMGKRSSRMAKREDYQNAFLVVEEAIGSSVTKNAEAVALGRIVGLKSGDAKAAKPSPERRKK
jgi:hypothetical protein